MRAALVAGAIAAAPLLAAAAPGRARRVWTSPAPGPAAVPGLVCRVASEADRPLRIRVQGVAPDGTPTSDTGFFRLEPEAVFQTGAGTGALRCRFEALSDEGSLRAAALLFDPRSQRLLWLPAEQRGAIAASAPPQDRRDARRRARKGVR